MALNAKNASGGGGKEFKKQENLEPGTYPGRLVQILDLGLQAQKPFQGKDKPPVNEIMFTYELVDTFMKDDDDEDMEDKPRWISESMALHNLKADLAKSTKRYNVFDPTGDLDGDFSKCIGVPVNVTVVNNAVGDKVFDNVGAITPMRPKEAAKCPELKNDPKVFDLDAPDMDVFNKLPKWIQDKIKSNLNFAGSALQKALGGKAPAKEEKQAKQEDDAEDNPY